MFLDCGRKKEDPEWFFGERQSYFDQVESYLLLAVADIKSC